MSDVTTAHVEECLERWRKGDLRSREDLLRVTSNRLGDLAHRMLRNFPVQRREADTADVLQGCHLRLWRALQKSVPESPRHYFNLAAQLMRQELIDMTRHFRRPDRAGHREINLTPASDSDTAPPDEPWKTTLEPADLAMWTEFHNRVEQLSPTEREAVDLLWYQGLSKTEAAQLMGVDVRSVYRYWHAAWEKLADTIPAQE